MYDFSLVHGEHSIVSSRKKRRNIYGEINKIIMRNVRVWMKDGGYSFWVSGFKPSVPEILTIALTAVKY